MAKIEKTATSKATSAAKTTAAVKTDKTATVSKEVEKTTAVKKAAETKPVAAAKTTKPAAKKTATKKAAAPKKAVAEPKATVSAEVFVQVGGNEYAENNIMEKVVAAWEAEGKKASAIKRAKLYIKPEDGKAYYVINEGLKNGTSGAVNL